MSGNGSRADTVGNKTKINHRSRPIECRLTLLIGAIAWLLWLLPLPAQAAQARIAVASNFASPARVLAADFSRRSGHHVEISIASTGKLYAQIHGGAPFDAFLSADSATPRKLVADGLAERDTLYDYAVGRLMLWSRDPARVHDGERLLRHGAIERLAIANPNLAPYGAAARETLRHVGRWDALRPTLVMGENVGQATHFVASGAAPLGLLPRSLVMEARKRSSGSGWEVPADWHAAIVQSAVLLRRGRENAAAREFLRYLRSPNARALIRAHGYD
ncbi:MAG: molybdate ABC transporter substrate-binding protein [Lysobacter sp.]|nr:molybdate ABC transporter substrate-binding protein [Lysobacter sp.]